jgi:prepilin signal peptidase PulO-like enzyme (type II secretory pathway)
MALHFPLFATLRIPHLTLVMRGWVPDWTALAAGVLGAGLGVAIAFMFDKLGSWLLPASRQTSFDSLVGEFGSGMWIGGFEERGASPRPQRALVTILAVAGACSAGGSLHRYGVQVTAVLATVFCLALAVIACICVSKQQMPDLLMYPLLWTGLLISVRAPFATPQSVIVGAIAGYLVPWLLCLPTRLLGRAAFSGADFKLYAATGAWLGVAATPQVLAVSVIIATVDLVAARLLGRVPDEGEGLKTFCPYIALAAGITMLCGVWINIPYLTAMGVLL